MFLMVMRVCRVLMLTFALMLVQSPPPRIMLLYSLYYV